MSLYRVVLPGQVERRIGGLPDHVRRRFYLVFAALEENPYRPRPGCDIRALSDSEELRAVRVGQYRAIYVVDESCREIRITELGHRRNVYR